MNIPQSEWNRIIAERCGWKQNEVGFWIHRDLFRNGLECEQARPPNFIGSLDAMAQAEATLTPRQLEIMERQLSRIIDRDTTDSDWREGYGGGRKAATKVWHATAIQRAEAFILATNPTGENE